MNLEIMGVQVKVDDEGFCSLNDLHKASGGDAASKPSHWLRSSKVNDLIDEILIAQKRAIKKSPGRYGGTFICRDLVYAYAMWVNASFHLKVIRAFDSQQNVQSQLDDLVSQVRAKAISISQAVDKTTSTLDEIKKHGSAWGAYGATIRRTKKQATKELELIKQEVQLKLDLLSK